MVRAQPLDELQPLCLPWPSDDGRGPDAHVNGPPDPATKLRCCFAAQAPGMCRPGVHRPGLQCSALACARHGQVWAAPALHRQRGGFPVSPAWSGPGRYPPCMAPKVPFAQCKHTTGMQVCATASLVCEQERQPHTKVPVKHTRAGRHIRLSNRCRDCVGRLTLLRLPLLLEMDGNNLTR